MKTTLDKLFDDMQKEDLEHISDKLDMIAKGMHKNSKMSERISSATLRKAGIAMSETKKNINIKRKIAVIAAVAAAAALTVTAGAAIKNKFMSDEEHEQKIVDRYGEEGAKELDEKGFVSDNAAFSEHFKISEEVNASNGFNTLSIITLEATDEIGEQYLDNNPNVDFDAELIGGAPKEMKSWGMGVSWLSADEKGRTYYLDFNRNTNDDKQIKISLYELIVPQDESPSERGELYGEIIIDAKPNSKVHELKSADGSAMNIYDFIITFDKELTTDSPEMEEAIRNGEDLILTEEEQAAYDSEVVLTLTMKDGSVKEYSRDVLSSSCGSDDNGSYFYLDNFLLDPEQIESAVFMGESYS